MYAARYESPGRIGLADLDPTPPGPGQVQIQPVYTGICGTDLHIFHGEMAARVPAGRVIGHETAGEVTATGPGVTALQVGDRVTVLPVSSCGHCAACQTGLGHICQDLDFLGIDSAGALQQRWTVPEGTLVRLPADLPWEVAALVEPTAVAVHDVSRAGVRAGEQVLVVGGGPVGILIALVARAHGADVRVVEPDAYRQSVARDLGFPVFIPDDEVPAMVGQWSGGTGVPVVFEVSGSAGGVATAVQALAVRGRLCLVAIHPRPREVDLHRFFWRELTLVGARLYVRADFERAVELLAAGHVPGDRLISAIRPLSQVAEAFAALQSGGVMKVLVDCRTGDGARHG